MIYLMRHGLDDETKVGGWSNISLVRSGEMQADLQGCRLRQGGYPIEKIISSDIQRCVQTAEIVNCQLHVPITYMQELREQNKGKLNGLDTEIADEIYPEYRTCVQVDTKFPEGESLLDLYMRIKDLLPWLLKQENSLIITHRGVINMIYTLLEKTTPDMNKKKYGVVHGSIHELDEGKKIIKRIL